MTSKLTADEAKWIKRVQRALDACPSDRIGFFTIGDHDVTLYNHDLERQVHHAFDNGSHEFCGAVLAVGADFNEYLHFPNQVHSTAG